MFDRGEYSNALHHFIESANYVYAIRCTIRMSVHALPKEFALANCAEADAPLDKAVRAQIIDCFMLLGHVLDADKYDIDVPDPVLEQKHDDPVDIRVAKESRSTATQKCALPSPTAPWC